MDRLVSMGVLQPLSSDDPFIQEARLLSTKHLLRTLPSLHMRNKSEGWPSMSLDLDISDAFLTVKQELPTVVRANVNGSIFHWRLLKMLPGQRGGASNWNDAFSSFLIEKCEMQRFPQCPALMATKD